MAEDTENHYADNSNEESNSDVGFPEDLDNHTTTDPAISKEAPDMPPPATSMDYEDYYADEPEESPKMPPPPPAQAYDSNNNNNEIPPPPQTNNPPKSLPKPSNDDEESDNEPAPPAYHNSPPQQALPSSYRSFSEQKESNQVSRHSPIIKQSIADEAHIEDVSFTSVLKQGEFGIESLQHMKEVIRKFCKHQQLSGDKLLEIYEKFPNNYKKNDAMVGFAELCSMVHQLIIETIKAQKKLADFLMDDVVPTMGKYVSKQQQKIQQLKRENQQAEMKVTNAENHMKKCSTSAKSLAMKSKKMMTAVKTQDQQTKLKNENKKKGGLKGMFKKMVNNPNSHLPEEEQMYLKAKESEETYEASVMAANYEQERYLEIQERFKKQIENWEEERISFGTKQISTFLKKYNEYWNTESLTVLTTKIISKMDVINSKNEFNDYIKNEIKLRGVIQKPKKYESQKYSYQNVFHSLDDAIIITKRIKNPHEKVPLIMTHLCDKVKECDGFKTEGIFRKSAMSSIVDQTKNDLIQNKYDIKTNDPHLPACVLKDWLRGLNDSLIPQAYYDTCIQMAQENKIKTETLEVFFSQIPEVNRETIKYLVKFLRGLLNPETIGITKMNIDNLAIVFGPTLLRCPSNDPQVLLNNSKHEKAFVVQLIEQLK